MMTVRETFRSHQWGEEMKRMQKVSRRRAELDRYSWSARPHAHALTPFLCVCFVGVWVFLPRSLCVCVRARVCVCACVCVCVEVCVFPLKCHIWQCCTGH